jgi:mono/diheme cytochrome c family protein
VLALVMLIPTILLGLADWQHYYADAMIAAIKYKMILAAGLAVGLLAVVFGSLPAKNANSAPSITLLLMTINMAITVAIGFFGGSLVFGGKQPDSPPAYQAGAKLFETNCVGCHARGGNVLDPNLPLIGAAQLASEADFVAFLRKPHMPGSTSGEMPDFAAARLSDQDASALYEYITSVLSNPRANARAK